MSAGFDYPGLAAEVYDLLRAAGRPARVLPPQAPANPAAPWDGPGPEVAPIDVVAVFVGPTQRPVPPGTVVSRIGRVLISALEPLPGPLGVGWSVLDGTRRVALSSLREVKPGAVSLLYVGEVAS